MTTYAVDASRFAQTSYSGLDIKAVVAHAGSAYILEPLGLSELSGDDDNGTDIAWSFSTGNVRLNRGIPSNIFQVTPLIRASQRVSLTLFANVRGKASTTIGPFYIGVPDRENLREWPTKTGEGHSPVSYAVQLSGSGAADIRGLEVYSQPQIRGR